MKLEIDIPAALVDAIAERAAALVLERLGTAAPVAEFVSVAEAAEIYRCKPQRIHDLLSAGELERVKEGGRTLIRRAQLLERVTGEELPPALQARRVAAA